MKTINQAPVAWLGEGVNDAYGGDNDKSEEDLEQIVDEDYVVEEDDNDIIDVQQSMYGRPREKDSNPLSSINVIGRHDEDLVDVDDEEISYDSEEMLQLATNSSSNERQQCHVEFDRNTMMNDPSFQLNFRGKFKGKELKDMIWNAARATILPDFRKWIEEIAKKNKEASEWLHHVDRPFNTWTRSLFRDDSKCDILLNNPCEIFNRYILDLRDKPIITMLEMIKNRISRRLHIRLELGKNWKGLICPKIQMKLEKLKVHAERYYAKIESGPNVRVEGPRGPFVVNTRRRSCTCRKWDLTGIPCPHGIATLQAEHKNVKANCDDLYSISNFRRVYSYVINPSRHENLWPPILNEMSIIPPPEKEKKEEGRKPTMRRKEAKELEIIAEKNKKQKLSKAGGTITCSICGATTHNRRFHKESSSQTVVNEAPIMFQTSQINGSLTSQVSTTNASSLSKLAPQRRMFNEGEPSTG